ncbi:MAG TPA: hypothetical protein VFE50_21115 [Cyclobacteriaceae bacterium]|nr:hypothetical protein [Cyclobacteriaceae bacterium]
MIRPLVLILVLVGPLTANGQEWQNYVVDDRVELQMPALPEIEVTPQYTQAALHLNGTTFQVVRLPVHDSISIVISNAQHLKEFYQGYLRGKLKRANVDLYQSDFETQNELLFVKAQYGVATDTCHIRLVFIRKVVYEFNICGQLHDTEFKETTGRFLNSVITKDVGFEDQLTTTADNNVDNDSGAYLLGQLFWVLMVLLLFVWLVFYIVILAGPGLAPFQLTYKLFTAIKWTTFATLMVGSLILLPTSLLLGEAQGNARLYIGIGGIVLGGLGILVAILKPRLKKTPLPE